MTEVEKHQAIAILLDRKSKELNVDVISYNFKAEGDAIVLAYRPIDTSYIVWTTYCTGEAKTSFVDFYNGKYDMTKENATQEYERRLK